MRFQPLGCTLFRDSRCTFQEMVQPYMVAQFHHQQITYVIVMRVLVTVMYAPSCRDFGNPQIQTNYDIM